MPLDEKYVELIQEALDLQYYKEYDKAIEKYKEAFEIDATVHDLSAYALCEYLSGNKEDGKDAIKKLIKKFPKVPFPYMDYATMLSKEEQYEEAIKKLKKALSVVPPKNPNANAFYSMIYLDMAKIYYHKNDFDQATNYALESIKYQKDFDAYYLLVCICEDTKDYPNQLKYALEMSQYFTEEHVVYYLLGNAYRNNGNRAKALECFKKETEHENPNAYAFYNLSLEYLNINDYENAKISSLRALELEKDDPDIWYNLACVYSLMGDWENTQSVLKGYLYMVDGNDEDIKTDPDFEEFRKTNEYSELMAMNKKN